MNVHEFGEKENPVLMLFPGTMCYWRGNFSPVIEKLSKKFLVSIVAYTGFDDTDTENYTTVEDELEKIESFVKENYNGQICAAYGCSLGGTFVAHLVDRHNIHMQYGIIGSSDMDQAGKWKASFMAALMVKVTYHFIHTGQYHSKLMQKRFKQQMEDPDPYNRAFVAMTGRDKYDMSFITKKSLKNQFQSDLITPLPEQIDNGETQVHVFYAQKMGEKYLERYRKYFKNPIIHEQDMRHEEFLGVYPDDWCALIEKICIEKNIG